jgi:preprotein translocase SecE subunit
MQNQRYILMAFLAIAAVLGVTLRSMAVDVLSRVDFGDPELLAVNTSGWIGIVAAVVCFFAMVRTKRIFIYTDEVVTELRKVAWPSRDETVRSSMVVVGFTLALASVLAAYDYLWVTITRAVLFSEG